MATLPEIKNAPGRSGGYVSMYDEGVRQLEHLSEYADITPEDEIYFKVAADCTKFVHTSGACIYTASIITTKGTDIGVIGAVLGGDAWEDMFLTAKPFFDQLIKLANDPKICTSVGTFAVKVIVGGDMCNLLEMFGLAKASSNHPCYYCILPKSQFAKVPYHPELLDQCNYGPLARTRSRIIEETRNSNRRFSVKNYPLCPLPLNPQEPLIETVLFDELHLIPRFVGKHLFGII